MLGFVCIVLSYYLFSSFRLVPSGSVSIHSVAIQRELDNGNAAALSRGSVQLMPSVVAVGCARSPRPLSSSTPPLAVMPASATHSLKGSLTTLRDIVHHWHGDKESLSVSGDGSRLELLNVVAVSTKFTVTHSHSSSHHDDHWHAGRRAVTLPVAVTASR
jgi:hypothetical protein